MKRETFYRLRNSQCRMVGETIKCLPPFKIIQLQLYYTYFYENFKKQ